jgi:transposase InsO family protein
MELDERTKRALFRFGVIAPLVSSNTTKEERRRIRRRILDEKHLDEDGNERKVSERTLCEWMKRYREKGFEGLHDAVRDTYGRCRAIPEEVLKAATELRAQEPALSIAQILELLPHAGIDDSIDLEQVSDSTLNRQLNRRGARKNVGTKEDGSFQRREEKFVNDVWQGDTADGPWLPDPCDPKAIKKTYLISYIDDASRFVPHAQFYWDTQLPSLLDCLRKALLKRGKPVRIYCDNAWIYHSTTLRLLYAQLDIRPSFSKKKRPPGRGKVERHIRTVQEGFMKIAEHAGIKTIDELNQFFFAWVSGKYHKSEHSELNKLSPMERWLLDKERIERVSPAEVRRGLMLRCQRRVNRKTATVRIDNVQYQVSVPLAGEKVEIRYHFNDVSEVEVWQRGRMLEIAKPVVVGRDIDFSRKLERKAETRERGKVLPAFKSYRLALTGGRAPESSLVGAGSLLTEAEFVELFKEGLKRQLSEGEDGLLRKFFGKYAPFEKRSTRALLEKIVEAAGDRQHLRVYCERLLEAALYGGKRNG